ncbi:MAG: AAA family ATPase [Chitinivibrionales bacterium]|nr:AAA family ATPase [Chitinivibrionales bacterium]MBD3395754.1 AAA family ATPase [Chitinivibrionales bacterium]
MQSPPESPAIQDILSGLNPPQVEAVTSVFDRHCLVLAGAGCGKTSVLTRRIAFCAITHCSQDKILALTFTRKAAEEMRLRVLELPGIRKDLGPPVITTFHGFGLSILRDTVNGIANSSRLGYSGEPKLLSSEDRLMALALSSTSPERQALGVDLFKLDDLLARHAVQSPRLQNLVAEKQAILGEIAGRFSRLKIDKNVWEFSDMITRALELCDRFPEIEQHYASRFKSVLVDEFQDTNPLQIRLLKKLLGGGTKLMAVGDDDQAIYGFRGADAGPTLDFTSHFNDAAIVKLETNYRSRPAILRAANRIFGNKPAAYRKILRSGKYASAGKERGNKPVRRLCATQREMVTWVLSEAQRTSRATGIPVDAMCMLFRLNETCDWTRECLANSVPAGIPVPRLMTIHGSKGLEFPVVFLCDLEESVLPNYRRRHAATIRGWGDLCARVFAGRGRDDNGLDLPEEMRLFYVGVTRAQERLYLVSARSKQSLGRSVTFRPSRFLRML